MELRQKRGRCQFYVVTLLKFLLKQCQMVPAWNAFYYPHVRHSPLMTCIFTAIVCRSNFDCIRDNTKLFNDRSDYSWDSDRREIDIKIVKLMFKQWSLMYRCLTLSLSFTKKKCQFKKRFFTYSYTKYIKYLENMQLLCLCFITQIYPGIVWFWVLIKGEGVK